MLVLQDCIDKLAGFKKTFAQKFGITKLGIFGSVARKENTENSDIDIVVEVEKPSLQLMYELKEALKQLFNCEVDLVRFRRLEDILESINLIQEWSEGRTTVNDFMTTPTGVMAFNACVMRLQIIGEHVGKLLKNENKPLDAYPNIPWNAIYGLRNIISHEYANIDEDIIVSVIKDDLLPLKEAIESLIKKY